MILLIALFPILIGLYLCFQTDIFIGRLLIALFSIIGLFFYACVLILYRFINEILRRHDDIAAQAARKTQALDAVIEMDKFASPQSDSRALLTAFLDKAIALTSAQKGSLFLVDQEDGKLSLVSAKGIHDLQEGARIPIDEAPFLKRVIADRKMLLVRNIEQVPGIGQKNNPRYDTPSFLIVPVSVGPDNVMAVINLTSKETGDVFDVNDAGALSVMQTGIRFNLENRQLQSQLEATIKDLTENNLRLQQEIAARRAAEASLKKLYEEFVEAEKLAAVGTCAAGVAHEVKNPLAIIIQGISYLQSSLGSNDMQQDVISRIKTAAMRANAIVQGLLSFTRQVPIQGEEVDAGALIDESLGLIENQLHDGKVQVIKRYAPNLPKVFVDGDQIKQVLINILTNATEAIGSGGTITITAGMETGTASDRYIEIVIEDTGSGMPEGILERVFDPFFTTKDNAGNIGLGLSISKGIINKHGGDIRIKSGTGMGTTVTIQLPVGGKQNSMNSNRG